MTSSDAGASFHWNFPSNFGDIHVGVYNGENYQGSKPITRRLLSSAARSGRLRSGLPNLRGFRAHLVYYNDHYQRDDERKRLMGNLTYEQKHLNAEFDYLSAQDQLLATLPDVSSHGWSVWATPRLPHDNGSSWEVTAAVRPLDPQYLVEASFPPASSPNPGVTTFEDQIQNRTIAGVAYWFPHQGNVSTALMLDYDGQSFKNITDRSGENRGGEWPC